MTAKVDWRPKPTNPPTVGMVVGSSRAGTSQPPATQHPVVLLSHRFIEREKRKSTSVLACLPASFIPRRVFLGLIHRKETGRGNGPFHDWVSATTTARCRGRKKWPSQWIHEDSWASGGEGTRQREDARKPVRMRGVRLEKKRSFENPPSIRGHKFMTEWMCSDSCFPRCEFELTKSFLNSNPFWDQFLKSTWNSEHWFEFRSLGPGPKH